MTGIKKINMSLINYLEMCKESSENLGHHRAEITKTYLCRKLDDNTTVPINIETMDIYEIIETDTGLEIKNVDYEEN
jgi:hypothetical protein